MCEHACAYTRVNVSVLTRVNECEDGLLWGTECVNVFVWE